MTADPYHGVFLARRREIVSRSPHTVYVHRDEAGQALYVGATYEHEARQRRHIRYSRWGARIARIDVDSVQPTRAHGRLREAELIHELRPPNNCHTGNLDRWRDEVRRAERGEVAP